MTIQNDIITAQQGEDVVFDSIVSSSQEEYIPFLISSQRENPHFTLTVASTKFEKVHRYVATWWLPVTIPRFFQTNVDTDSIGEVNYATGTTNPDLPNSPPNDAGELDALYQFTLSTDEVDRKVGHKPYHYVYYTVNDDETGYIKHIDEYECRITFNLLSNVTSEWSAQNYLYQIMLVSGQLMSDRLDEIEAKYNPENWPDADEERFEYVKLHWPDELQSDIDAGSKLGKIWSPQVVKSQAKLIINNNLRILI